jgi:two-component system, OmpR family, phosphate regulon sensor histidine kinase PhoR
MNDGLFTRDLIAEDDVWIGGIPSGLGRGTPFRIPAGPVPAGLPAPFAVPQDGAHLIRALRERLRDSESELGSANAILALHPEPILVIDDTRAILRGNAAARTLFHGDADGRGAGAMLDHKEVVQAAISVFAGHGRQVVDVKLSGPTDRHLRAQIELLPDYHALRPTALLTVTDLTEVKRAEQLRADFVANASHELRTPLAVLLGFIETLTGPAADDPVAQREFLGIMQQQANRMARLVDDLLSLSKIELTEHAAPTRRVQVAEVVGPIARALDLRAAERGMVIELVVAPNLPPVPGEPDELAQLVQNLIDNAIKYAKPDTAITVTVGPSTKLAHGVMVRVRDRGEGIAKRHLARLTERFYRVDKARSSQMAGTGLGLAIVKHVVNRHNGILEIDSKIGRGSRFTVHLPGPQDTNGRPLCN